VLQAVLSNVSTAIYGAVQRVPGDTRAVYVDSGCTKSVFCNTHKLVNVRKPDRPYRIIGVGGQLKVSHIGDFPLALRSEDGQTYTVVIKDCLVAPDAFTNLLAVTDMSKSGIAFSVPAGDVGAVLTITRRDKNIAFKLQNVSGLYQLPYYKDVMTHFAGASSHQLRSLTEFELWHRRLGHAGAKKLAKLSQHCTGMPPLAERDFVCHQCHEGRAKRQDYPPTSTK
jgi:hypothetical protein